MAPSIAYTLPAMQLVCNLVMPDIPGFNISDMGLTVTESPSKIQFETLPDGYILHPEIATAYKVYTDSVTWKAAKLRCIQEGARLAVIDSWMKFEYLMNQTSSDAIHVGIQSMYDDTEWVSATTGLTVTSVPWAPGDPSGGHDCVSTSSSPRGLRNYPCTRLSHFVCELPIPDNYDIKEKPKNQIPAN